MNCITLTKTMAAGLRWFAAHEPVALFDASAPSPVIRKRLRTAKLIEECGYEPGRRIGCIMFRVSARGRRCKLSNRGDF